MSGHESNAQLIQRLRAARSEWDAAGDDVAFASCLIHCEGTSAGALDLRLTVGLRKIRDEWIVMHEHHSVPSIEERFTNPSDAAG